MNKDSKPRLAVKLALWTMSLGLLASGIGAAIAQSTSNTPTIPWTKNTPMPPQPSNGGTTPKPSKVDCGRGYHWDAQKNTCVMNPGWTGPVK